MVTHEDLTVITVTRGGKTIELTMPWDANLDDWGDMFRIILKWATFPEETINNLFKE